MTSSSSESETEYWLRADKHLSNPAIFQVGQVLQQPENCESAILTSGPWPGEPHAPESIKLGARVRLTKKRTGDEFLLKTGCVEKKRSVETSNNVTITDRWTVIEKIVPSSDLCEWLLEQEEISRYVTRNRKARLFVVTKVKKVRQRIGADGSQMDLDTGPEAASSPVHKYVVHEIVYGRKSRPFARPYERNRKRKIISMSAIVNFIKPGTRQPKGDPSSKSTSYKTMDGTSRSGIVPGDSASQPPARNRSDTRTSERHRDNLTSSTPRQSEQILRSSGYSNIIPDPFFGIEGGNSTHQLQGKTHDEIQEGRLQIPRSRLNKSPRISTSHISHVDAKWPPPKSAIGVSNPDQSASYWSQRRMASSVTATAHTTDAIEAEQKEHVFDDDHPQLSALVGSAETDEGADDWFHLGISKVHEYFSAAESEPDLSGERQPVKIAILDTGLDLKHPIIAQYIQSGQISTERCWDFTQGLENQQDCMIDEIGHGTHCMHLLLKTFPTAEVYVARVFETAEAMKPRSAYMISMAIKTAVTKWKVDIISMSFAFKRTQDLVRAAIRSIGAEDEGEREVLLFAAASNMRHLDLHPTGWPATHPDVIRVNSCNYAGIKSTFSPVRGANLADGLAVLGERVNAAFPLILNRGNTERRKSGTSMATPILAGIAGLVIEFARNYSYEIGEDLVKRLLDPHVMTNIFIQLMVGNQSTPKIDEYLHIKPWLLFDMARTPEDVARRIRTVIEETQ